MLRWTVHVVGTCYSAGEGCAVLCSSDAGKGADDDRALAAKGGVAEVTELMELCVHRPPKYIATQYA
jgi:hypothetical protein